MSDNATSYDREAVRRVLDQVRAEGRDSLTAPEGRLVVEAYGIATPREGLAESADEAVTLAGQIGLPVVLKIVSPDILHKTEAGGVLVGLKTPAEVADGFRTIVDNAKAYRADARIVGVQVQQLLTSGHEVIVGTVTDKTFGKVVAFGLGGVLVEVLKDVTFRLAPADHETALSMIDGIAAAEILRGVRGAEPANREVLAGLIQRLSDLVTDFPELAEVDLNPVLATASGATAVDVRILVDDEAAKTPERFSEEEILASMNRIMRPAAVAVIGASAETGKIGNSVMKNLVNGGYQGEIYPINPKADEILDRKAFKSIADVPGPVDVAVFAIPAKFVPQALEEVGAKGVAGAILIPSGFGETGNHERRTRSWPSPAGTAYASSGRTSTGTTTPRRTSPRPSARRTTSRVASPSPRRAAGSAWRSSASAGPRRWASPRSSA